MCGGCPVCASVAGPGRLGLEVGIADGGGVRVVEGSVGGNSESIAAAGAQLQVICDAQAAGELRSECGLCAAGEDFFACTEGEIPALLCRSQIEVNVTHAAIARVQAEVVAVDAVAVCFKTEEQQRWGGDRNCVANGRLPGTVPVIVLVDGWVIAQQDEIVGVTAV